MEMKFPEDYPMAPPFVRVIRPTFKFLTGTHMTSVQVFSRISHNGCLSKKTNIQVKIIK